MTETDDRVQKILEKLNPDAKRREIRELEAEMEKPEFWQNREEATRKTKQLSALQDLLTKLEKLENGRETEELVRELETRLYLSGPYDYLPAIVSIHSGQGGVEAMDWAEMLYRMYSKFAAEQGWELAEIDLEPGSEAGIKTVTFETNGNYAYGFLKYEAGVHRLVRQSPFNADHLRQTSFALVEVMPGIENAESAGEETAVKEEDLVWDFFRAGGHGGQNVNKVSSAVRLTHKPTGIVVTSQKERDQSRNREIALKILRGKLAALVAEKRHEEEMRLRGKHVTPGWGNQIRSYVLHPYHLVKDLRTDYEETDSDAVLEGHLNKFIEAELHYFART